MHIEVLNNQKDIGINKRKIKQVAIKFLKYLRQRKNCHLSITFVSPSKIKQLNKKYFKKNRVTDVIAVECGVFDKGVYSNYLGDIVICPQIAKENSKRFKSSLKNEISLYIAHGILHLLNYDDLKRKDRLQMEKRQRKLMNLLK